MSIYAFVKKDIPINVENAIASIRIDKKNNASFTLYLVVKFLKNAKKTGFRIIVPENINYQKEASHLLLDEIYGGHIFEDYELLDRDKKSVRINYKTVEVPTVNFSTYGGQNCNIIDVEIKNVNPEISYAVFFDSNIKKIAKKDGRWFNKFWKYQLYFNYTPAIFAKSRSTSELIKKDIIDSIENLELNIVLPKNCQFIDYSGSPDIIEIPQHAQKAYNKWKTFNKEHKVDVERMFANYKEVNIKAGEGKIFHAKYKKTSTDILVYLGVLLSILAIILAILMYYHIFP